MRVRDRVRDRVRARARARDRARVRVRAVVADGEHVHGLLELVRLHHVDVHPPLDVAQGELDPAEHLVRVRAGARLRVRVRVRVLG